MSKKLCEGLSRGDLSRLVKPILSIDEFRSKMGDDKDIIVLGFTVTNKEPALDLTNFIEKSYDWVLDADVSSGELFDGNYNVFVEIQRKQSSLKKIINLINDINNLIDHKLSDWSFTYYQNKKTYPLTFQNLKIKIITSVGDYQNKINHKIKESNLNILRNASGIKIPTTVITDASILNVQRAAGII